jgi:serine/threonine protein kinase/DNA-binding winged helix-turn-helix (wHTH) protein/tetratricopeptide (TPR) repeat protein
MEGTLQGRVRFGPFELDPRAGELHNNGESVILQEQQLKVLLMLIERKGEIATREEIKKKLWPNDTVVEFDHGINSTIRKLRNALGDSAEKPRYIETISRRGYRLLVPVEWPGLREDVAEDSSAEESSAGSVESSGPDSDTETLLPRASLKVGRLTGKIVSHYRVLEVIGGGGMGLVYRAEDLKLGRAVALKFLPEEVGDDPKARERFQREAKAVSALNHLNICTVYDFDEHEGHPFIAMELLQGKTLREHLADTRFRLSQPEGMEVAIQIASGLEAAHEKGIIHRDVKPANIFITDKNVAKILDFGVAKVLELGEPEIQAAAAAGVGAPGFCLVNGETRQKAETTLTRTGMKLGTAGYMSPEQVRGEPLDVRTDIFSFGLVLYEMATGERAFTGETEAILHDAIQHRDPRPVRELVPEISPKLESLISKCLAKEREQRYQAAWEITNELRELEAVVPVVSPGGESVARRWLVGAVLVFIFIGAISIALYRRVRPSPKLTDQDTIVLADFENKTSDPVFDTALKPALAVAFGQTPFLNPLSGEKVSRVLKTLNRPPNEKLVPAVALQVCRSTNSSVYVTGSIADAGNQYRVALSAVDCKTGSTLASSSANAEGPNQVVTTLGDVAHQLRERLGEPSESLQRYNKPLAEATSASLEALQALQSSTTRFDTREAIAGFNRAIQQDPAFAQAYDYLGIWNLRLGRPHSLIAENFDKAYRLRERRLSRRDQFAVEAAYHQQVTGQFDKVISITEQAIQEYPRWDRARHILGLTLAWTGELERAAGIQRDVLRLAPDDPASYPNLVDTYTQLGRLEDADLVLDEAKKRNIDVLNLHRGRYRLAFLQNDSIAIGEQVNWAKTVEPGLANLMLREQSETEAYRGRMRKADEFSREAAESAEQAGALNRASEEKSTEALRAAVIGDTARARKVALQVFSLDPEAGAKVTVARALAIAGDASRALQIAQELGQEAPTNTLLQGCSLPAIRAEVYLQQSKPDLAIKVLEDSAPQQFPKACEVGSILLRGLGWAYLRGEAYLKAQRSKEAAADFEAIIKRPGVAINSGDLLTTALAHLQLARGYAMMGDKEAARKSYQDFLTLWKDADPDIPIYKQAKAEYQKLGKSAAQRQLSVNH